jgi:DNA invertase Pin-like site-specific DNA recombinase
MHSTTNRAAQYIRMSTDPQELSPVVQKDAIAEFARTNGFEIVRSYEDEGKSGLQLVNRPRLRQLLADVAAGASFSAILVYDVSRWGRFQDADAAAYHEYHCRLHGVQVIYVCESFGNDQTPATVLLKTMRRVMAAEYSRDLASKPAYFAAVRHASGAGEACPRCL